MADSQPYSHTGTDRYSCAHPADIDKYPYAHPAGAHITPPN
jgi:hypothetical protein